MGKGSKKARQKVILEERAKQVEISQKILQEEVQRQLEQRVKTKEELEQKKALRQKRKQDEIDRLKKEAEEDQPKIKERAASLAILRIEQVEQTKWKKHLACDPTPDASVDRELNSFVTVWSSPDMQHRTISEDAVEEIQPVIEGCSEASRIAGGVLANMCKAGQHRDYDALGTQEATFQKLKEETDRQIDKLVVSLLVHKTFRNVIAETPNEEDKILECKTDEVLFGVWGSTMANAFRNKKIEFDKLAWHIELPKTLAMKSQCPLGCVAVYLKNNYFAQMNRGRYVATGGVYTVRLLTLPPAVTEIADWTVRKVTQATEKVVCFDYGNNQKVDEAAPETAKYSVTVPESTFVVPRKNGSPPELGWWDYDSKTWKTTDFQDQSWDPSTRTLVFTTCHLRPCALVQERGIDFCTEGWSMAPNGVEKCLMTLRGQRLAVKLEIVGGDCHVLEPEFPDLAGRMLKPYELIAALQAKGIRLWPTNRDLEILGMVGKEEVIEQKANKEVASIACFELKGSRWNLECGTDKVVFQMRRPLSQEEKEDMEENVADARWMRCMVTQDKCSVIKAEETTTRLALDSPDDELSHTSMRRVAGPHSSDDMVRDLRHASLRYQEAVRRMLNITRVFLL